ncbi:MAG: hypothetical protein PF482_14465 [Desulfobacteraceae bacterium]|jgi:hypothetical protein|nr:hypothetical protein [Desulfobacteraceae bacterium]
MKEIKERQWVKISQAKGLQPFSTSTLYKLHHRREHMNLFSKVGGSVFVDIKGVHGLIDQNAGQAA